MKRNKTIKWSPVNLQQITASNCIYVGEAEVYPQDPHSGEVSHGERKRTTPVYGYPDDDLIQFVAAFNVTDKYESLKIDGSHTISGGINKTGRYRRSNYKIGFTCSLLHLESQATDKKDTINNNITYFCGNARMSYVPWSELVDIKVTYYLYKNYLAYITFNLTKEQYNTWLEFKELHMTIYDHGNVTEYINQPV